MLGSRWMRENHCYRVLSILSMPEWRLLGNWRPSPGPEEEDSSRYLRESAGESVETGWLASGFFQLHSLWVTLLLACALRIANWFCLQFVSVFEEICEDFNAWVNDGRKVSMHMRHKSQASIFQSLKCWVIMIDHFESVFVLCKR